APRGRRASRKRPLDLVRGATAGGDRAVDGASIPLLTSGFAREEQRSAQRARERSGSFDAANHLIAVGAARERVVFPVVIPRALDHVAHLARRDPELASQRLNGELLDLFRRELRECPASNPAMPAHDHWRAHGIRRPPHWEMLIL